MLKTLITIFFLTQVFICYSQSDSLKNDLIDDSKVDTKYTFGVKTEYSHQNAGYLSIGISYLNPSIYETACATYPVGLRGVSFSVDFSLNKPKEVFIPKISYEATFMFLTGKLSAGMATDFSKKEFVISPEIGLSALGFLYVLYGYNITTNSNDFHLRGSKISIGLNINPRVKWKDGYKNYIWD
jgi:hypothetical protein